MNSPEDNDPSGTSRLDSEDTAQQPGRRPAARVETRTTSESRMPDTGHGEFVKLIMENQRLLYGYIFALVPRWNDAEDILQRTNMRLWEELDRYQPGTNFSAWAMRVAYYEVKTWRNSVARSKLVFDTALVEELAKCQAEISERLQARRLALARCMEQLPESQLDVLRRCYSERVRIKEVAASLGRSAESVYKAVQRLRAVLRDCVNQRLEKEGSL